MGELMRNPTVMQKVQEEVRRALAEGSLTNNLHYFRPVIKETLLSCGQLWVLAVDVIWLLQSVPFGNIGKYSHLARNCHFSHLHGTARFYVMSECWNIHKFLYLWSLTETNDEISISLSRTLFFCCHKIYVLIYQPTESGVLSFLFFSSLCLHRKIIVVLLQTSM